MKHGRIFERKLHALEALLATLERGSEHTPFRNSLVERAGRRLGIIAEVMTARPPAGEGWRPALAAMRDHLGAAAVRWDAEPLADHRDVALLGEQLEHATDIVRDALRDYALYLDPEITVRLREA